MVPSAEMKTPRPILKANGEIDEVVRRPGPDLPDDEYWSHDEFRDCVFPVQIPKPLQRFHHTHINIIAFQRLKLNNV
jgi:hypothetical protein